ncbi:hypothetical protein Pelo_1041 [Pelomyxa schiedti]|nr:hypothetical protein Pelo_1041 [Pelomyxa schiedti]
MSGPGEAPRHPPQYAVGLTVTSPTHLLSARDQLGALLTAHHSRCGARSPAMALPASVIRYDIGKQWVTRGDDNMRTLLCHPHLLPSAPPPGAVDGSDGGGGGGDQGVPRIDCIFLVVSHTLGVVPARRGLGGGRILTDSLGVGWVDCWRVVKLVGDSDVGAEGARMRTAEESVQCFTVGRDVSWVSCRQTRWYLCSGRNVAHIFLEPVRQSEELKGVKVSVDGTDFETVQWVEMFGDDEAAVLAVTREGLRDLLCVDLNKTYQSGRLAVNEVRRGVGNLIKMVLHSSTNRLIVVEDTITNNHNVYQILSLHSNNHPQVLHSWPSSGVSCHKFDSTHFGLWDSCLGTLEVFSTEDFDCPVRVFPLPHHNVGCVGTTIDNADPTISSKDSVTLMSVGEGFFPLVPRTCRLVLSHDNKYYNALEAAAEAGAQSCLNWLITNHNANNNNNDGVNDQAGNRRNETKEFIRVVGGLCCGGHLDTATRLMDVYRGGHGHWPSNGITWWGGCRGEGEGYIVEHVKMENTISEVCRRGHLDVAKWMVERFGYTDHWELLYGPLTAALSKGRLEVAKWIMGEINDPQSVKKYFSGRPRIIHGLACRSGNVEAIKWVLHMFPLDYTITGGTFFHYLRENCTAVCECIKEHAPLPFNPGDIDSIPNAEVLRWTTSAFPSFKITSEIIQIACPKEGGLDLLKWAIEDHSVTPTPELFRAACKNRTENLEVMKWLSTKVTLSPEDACECFAISLSINNITTASWLDESFGIMKHATTTPFGVGSVFVRVCKHITQERRIEGVKWILNHPGMSRVEERLIVKAVRHLVFKKNLSVTPLLIIEKFPLISEPTRTEVLIGVLQESVQGDTITQVKKVISMDEFTKESVAQCLANPELNVFGSMKALKWLITHFQLEREHIALNNNTLLQNLLKHRKASCAEWVINRFHITLDEVLLLTWEPSPFTESDLFTWHMMLRVFPGITAETVKQHWMCFVTNTPVIAQFTMRVFPDITTRDIADYWSEQKPWKRPSSIRNWLGDAFPVLCQL